MNRIFSIFPHFRVLDGTWVSPFLNAKDSQSDLLFDLLHGFSLSAGVIKPRSSSRIHIMLHVTQVTFVLSGKLTVLMKGTDDVQLYPLHLTANQAALTEPGAFFQLINGSSEDCNVLYVVSPAYIFEMDPDGTVLYDDSLVLEDDWDKLAAAGWQVRQSMPTLDQRAEALQRLAGRKANP